jgi:pyrroline-5-carboxylate reductase
VTARTRCSEDAIAFVGAGNLSWSLVAGLLARGTVSPRGLRVCNRSDDLRLKRFEELGARVGRDKALLLRGAGTIVLAVKPADAVVALGQAAPHVEPGALVVSTVAGMPLGYLGGALPAGTRIVRAMPNTSCQVGESATAIAASPATPRPYVERARRLLSAVGAVYEVPERLLDAVTAVSGSGPAYFYYFTESLIRAAEEAGLDGPLARELALQTMRGAAAMLGQPDADPSALRAQVTSPQGTTEAALRAMAELRLPEAVRNGVLSALRRSAEISAGFRGGTA